MDDIFLDKDTQKNFEVLRAALNFMPTPVLIAQVMDGLYHVLYSSQKFLEIIGYSAESISDINKWYEIAYPDPLYRKKIMQKWDEATENALLCGKNEVSVIAKVYCKNKEYRWFNIRSTIMGDMQYVTFLDVNELEIKRQELAESEQKFKLLAENIPAIIYLCKDDEQWSMLYLNDYTEKITGYSKNDFLENRINLADLYHPEDSEELNKEFNKSRQKLQAFRLKYRLKHKNGQYRWVEEHGAFIKTTEGEILIEGVITDINDRIKSEQLEAKANERLKIATEGTEVGVWEMDLVNNKVYWDKMLYKLLGLPKSIPLDTLNLSDYIYADDRERVKNYFETAHLKGNKYYIEFRVIKPNGEIRHLSNSGLYKKDKSGKPTHLVGITYDITNQKVHEESILKLNKELEDINIQKNKLFSIIAHDLRGPVGRNRALLDIIMHDLEGMSKEDIHTHLELLQNGTENINKLLEDLLLWSRTQFDSIKFSPDIININDEIPLVLELMKDEAHAKSIELVSDVRSSSHIIADPNMFKTILRNLIANAIKFSHEESKIEIVAENGNAEIIFKVRDYGIGMNKETLREVMAKNSKYTSFGTKGEKGSGLGLSICREFLAKHSKFMKIISKPEKGTTFMFSFNVAHVY